MCACVCVCVWVCAVVCGGSFTCVCVRSALVFAFLLVGVWLNWKCFAKNVPFLPICSPPSRPLSSLGSIHASCLLLWLWLRLRLLLCALCSTQGLKELAHNLLNGLKSAHPLLRQSTQGFFFWPELECVQFKCSTNLKLLNNFLAFFCFPYLPSCLFIFYK